MLGGGDRRARPVREDYVELDDPVHEEAPDATVVPEAAERAVAADADPGTGAVWKTKVKTVSGCVSVPRERRETYARPLRLKILVAMLPSRAPPPTVAILVVLSSVTSWNWLMLMTIAPDRPYAP